MTTFFNLLPEHITLLRNSYTSWDNCEFGATQIDPKRPYGNSDVYSDIYELLYPEDKDRISNDDGPGFSDDELDYMLKLHKETETALQIVLRTGQFKPGKYRARFYYDWEYVGELS